MLTKQLLSVPLLPRDCLQLALLGFLDADLRWLPTQTERALRYSPFEKAAHWNREIENTLCIYPKAMEPQTIS